MPLATTARPASASARASASFVRRLDRALRGRTWTKGAVNYDEDLHFSSYYLRASDARQTGRLYPGYGSVVASFEGWKETYWLLEEECRATSDAIIARALRERDWLPGVLRQIRLGSDSLARIFPARTSAESLRRLSRARLLALYERHDAVHRAFYVPARLPEALDRGVSRFTTFLGDVLRAKGLSDEDARETFQTLTEPLVPSVLTEEIGEFDAIVEAARESGPGFPAPALGPGRARMQLPPSILSRLERHVAKWRHVPYHGYGRRQLATLDDAVARLLVEVAGPRRHATTATSSRRAEVLERLRLDPAHAALFEVYPEIGAVKLYRRSAQLANFYFLDLLLAEIARRLEVTEWTVRCLLPDEVVASLEQGAVAVPDVGARLEGCVFAVLEGEERVLVGEEAAQARRLLRREGASPPAGGAMQGVVACPGRARARCRVVIRAADGEGLAPGTIVVSESTDPDLLPLLRVAGAVLTEQGGVTSHAAIVCRELGVPTIIGIDGLLERVRDGDLLDVDARAGTVRVIESARQDGAATGFEVGAKARNLAVARALGFRVPDFSLLSWDEARAAASEPGAAATAALVARIESELGADARLAVRSSALAEDGETASGAGDFTTLLDLTTRDLPDALARFVAANGSSRTGAGYRGSVIVQRLVVPQRSGVAITHDPRVAGSGALVIEMLAGGNEGITSGRVRPDRFVVDRVTGDILEESRTLAGGTGPIDVTGLARDLLRLEAGFGHPLDVEWALEGGQLVILQARPIVQGSKGAARDF